MKLLKFALLLLVALPLFAGQAPRLGRLLGKAYPQMGDDDRQVVLVSFADKGTSAAARLAAAPALVSERSLHRRAKMRPPSGLLDEADLPLERSYVDAVRGRVVAVRHELKWFNAVSVVATRRQIDALARLPFVTEIELVGRWKKRAGDEAAQPLKPGDFPPAPSSATSLDYGTSLTQNSLMNVPAVHDLGIYGQGVVIGVFDNGFRNPAHPAFASMHIIAQHDFVDHKESTVPNAPESGYGSHGVWTLSTIGGYVPGQLIGPAFRASFILARTENDSSETPIEEDNWAKAIEWADSLGIDVASTSLGYLTYDAPYTSLTAADMNGTTALITRAADRASSLGIVVVNSAGNQGPGDGVHNTLIAPADGFNVITAGAVNSAGTRASFSSVGPTTDVPSRIKPDVMAMGVSVKAASSTDLVSYVGVSGTSFSCPLSAGVAALVLCANPSLTPFQVREAMRNTASNSGSPNNQFGWGIVNALAAINYYGGITFPHIAGRVYHDQNVDSLRENGEPGIAGVTIRLSGAAVDSTVTDTLGNFTFSLPSTGAYVVSADLVPGWAQTAPAGGSAAVSIDSLQQNATGVEIGFMKPGRIAGTVFRDLNMDGGEDPGEPKLAGAVFHLDGPSFFRAVSDSLGAFLFAGLAPGTYVLSESLKAGWIRTAPEAAAETLAVVSATDTAGLRFGIYFPGESFVFTGWNMLSLPQRPADRTVSALYPEASSPAFGYGPGYKTYDTIPVGAGYWLRFSAGGINTIGGDPVASDTIGVVTGWNLIGTIAVSVPVSALVQEPGSNLVSLFYDYDGEQYHAADTLRPYRGYWVKAAGVGSLILNPDVRAGNVPAGASPERAFAPVGELIVRDRSGLELRLPVGDAAPAERGLLELPPAPPAGVFDARFASQQSVEFLSGGAGEFPVQLSSAAYPVTVTWSGTASVPVVLRAGDASIDLSAGRPVRLASAAASYALLVGGSAVASLPAAFALGQNYPNPFNPTTQISYAVAAPSRVTVSVFSVLGEKVATLADEDLPAGTYRAVWNASASPSGVYYCIMRAGGFSSVRKMVLLK
jgi:hypothetical protein